MQVPYKTSSGISTLPIETKLLESRKIFLTGKIEETVALDLVKQIMWLNEEGDMPIYLYINSPGGNITDGMMIYDRMMASRAPVYTCCLGEAHSMAAVLFASGRKRLMMPNSSLMIHQPSLGCQVSGNASSIRSVADSLLEAKKRMNRILARHTGRTVREVDAQTAYDHYFTPQEAIDWGLCDKIADYAEMMGE
jgi:ATP-dependent Clp protease protease subunit